MVAQQLVLKALVVMKMGNVLAKPVTQEELAPIVRLVTSLMILNAKVFSTLVNASFSSFLYVFM